MIKWLVRVNRQVSSVVGVGIIDSQNDEGGEEAADEEIKRAEEGDHEGINVESDDTPVKGGKGVHAKTSAGACNRSKSKIVGRNPSHPAKCSKRSEDIVGQPEEAKHAHKGDEEELEARHAPHLFEGTQSSWVGIAMERRVEGDSHERRGPYTIRWVHEESPADTSQAVADEVAGESDGDLITEVDGPLLVEELRQELNPDKIMGIRRALGNTGHEGNEHVLLLVEWTRVQAVANSPEGKSNIRQSLLPKFTERIGQ